MHFILQPWHLVILALANIINQEQAKVVVYLKAENRVLREQLQHRGGRVRFTEGQRHRLAAAAKALGRSILRKLETIVTPDTLPRWHRLLVARKYDGSEKRCRFGRPRIMRKVEELVARMARDNPRWGYTRIRGALWNLGHDVARTTIANILVRYHLFFVMKIATRQVKLAGIKHEPHGVWMEQIARNLTDAFEGFLRHYRYLICDRDPLYTTAFRNILFAAGVKTVRLPPRSPNLNPHAERFVLSIKSECLDRLILFSEKQLRNVVSQYVLHYHTERNHQGLDNRLLEDDKATRSEGQVLCRERLGGLLRYYHRKAA
jgi:transposase InsO family protein